MTTDTLDKPAIGDGIRAADFFSADVATRDRRSLSFGSILAIMAALRDGPGWRRVRGE